MIPLGGHGTPPECVPFPFFALPFPRTRACRARHRRPPMRKDAIVFAVGSLGSLACLLGVPSRSGAG